MKSIQYAYFYGSYPFLVVLALKGMDYYNSPLVQIAERGKDLAHLRFSPETFDDLLERTLSFSDAQVVKFVGIKGTDFQSAEERRPFIQKRKITYEALDGKFAILEMKYKYSIVPTQITFFVPGKALFILKERDYSFFRREIICPTLESALEQKNIL